jgi:hypothetical protein
MDLDALGDPSTPDDIEGWVAQAIGDAPWVMVGALTRADYAPGTLAALRTHGRQLLVDGQGFVRRGTLGSLVRGRSIVSCRGSTWSKRAARAPNRSSRQLETSRRGAPTCGRTSTSSTSSFTIAEKPGRR